MSTKKRHFHDLTSSSAELGIPKGRLQQAMLTGEWTQINETLGFRVHSTPENSPQQKHGRVTVEYTQGPEAA